MITLTLTLACRGQDSAWENSMNNERKQAIKILYNLELITGQPVPGWSREAVLVAIMSGMYNGHSPDNEVQEVVDTIAQEEKREDGPFFGL